MQTQAKIITRYEHEIDDLKQTVDQLQHQVDWFKRQLFGQKSERRLHLDEQQEQLSLGLVFDDEVAQKKAPETRLVAAHLRQKSHPKDQQAASGFEFSDEVPVKEIRLSCPQIKDLDENDYEVIGEKISYRLAQNPSSYVVLKYIRPVVKLKAVQLEQAQVNVTSIKPSSTIISTPAPEGVLGHSRADVSFIAGLLVDKFAYHLPLYRQHQRLEHGGIKVNRNWLTRIVHQACSLLRPIHLAVVDSILRGHTISMDEVPVKAGRAKKGKMHQGYYWPIFGEKGEVAFIYKPSRRGHHVHEILGRLKPDQVLLSDGYAAYASYA